MGLWLGRPVTLELAAGVEEGSVTYVPEWASRHFLSPNSMGDRTQWSLGHKALAARSLAPTPSDQLGRAAPFGAPARNEHLLTVAFRAITTPTPELDARLSKRLQENRRISQYLLLVVGYLSDAARVPKEFRTKIAAEISQLSTTLPPTGGLSALTSPTPSPSNAPSPT
jgi:hypothetical protein